VVAGAEFEMAFEQGVGIHIDLFDVHVRSLVNIVGKGAASGTGTRAKGRGVLRPS
jgi:hypothetical protein